MSKPTNLPKDGPLLDLTLREAAEAENFGLSIEDYSNLRKSIEARLKIRITEEIRESLGTKFKAELRSDLLPVLRDEIRPEIERKIKPEIEQDVKAKFKAALEKDIKEDARREAEQSILQMNQSRAPTQEDLYNFTDVARQIEVDCLALADVASRYADRARAWQWFTHYVLRTTGFTGLAMSLPVGLYLYYVVHLGNAALYSASLFQVFSLVTVFILCGLLGSAAEKKIETFGKVSSKFLAAADLARYKHVFEASTHKTTQAMSSSLDDLRRTKGSVDDQFYPSTQVLARSRVEVLQQLNASMDAERVLRLLDAPNARQDTPPV